MNPTISIIANFYKSRKYIPKLLKSVFNQTYTDWELICIDDCSPTNDYELLQKITNREEMSNKVRIIRNETNLGITRAKKVGIDNARGEYLTFIDGDDWFAPQALEKLITPAQNYNLDFVVMNNYKIIPIINYKWLHIANVLTYNKPIYAPDLFDSYYINFFGLNIFPNNAYWGKLYKRDILLNPELKYPQNDIYEDNIFLFRLFPSVKSMMFIDYPGYYWRWGGITSGRKNSFYKSDLIIRGINDFAIERINAINKFNYNKALKWLLIETKNVLAYNISCLAKYPVNSTKGKEIISLINNILLHPIYEYIKELPIIDSNYNNEYIRAIINKDSLFIYRHCHQIYKHDWHKRLYKKLLHTIIYPFSKY